MSGRRDNTGRWIVLGNVGFFALFVVWAQAAVALGTDSGFFEWGRQSTIDDWVAYVYLAVSSVAWIIFAWVRIDDEAAFALCVVMTPVAVCGLPLMAAYLLTLSPLLAVAWAVKRLCRRMPPVP